MRRILLTVLGISTLLIPSVWLGVGCAAGSETNVGSKSSGTGKETDTGTSTGTGGSGGTGGASATGTGGSTGGSGGSTGGSGGSTGGSGGCVPSVEVCDGVDNDCNGIVDDKPGGCDCKDGDTKVCFTGDPATLGVGVCANGTSTCDIQGVWGPCAGEVTASMELCDGLDNDCNGQIDENLGSTTCGQGICSVTVPNCVNGVTKVCIPDNPKPETCNGTDDNCNGVVDEGCTCIDGKTQACYTGPGATQGVGACKDGMQTCVNGNWDPCMGDITPVPETCNALDDDCNGVVDDGLGTQNCGVGACQKTVPVCVGGQIQNCVPGQPSPEICDGIDNDCNAQVDDGLGTVTCGLGECVNTVPACKNGQQNICQPLQAIGEICDGKDNNCNGFVDDGDPQGGAACMTNLPGECKPGTEHCQNGGIACVQNKQASPEICDGKDNNCDGNVDEGNPGSGQPCNTGLLGVCAAGHTTCQNGVIACIQNVQPSAEVCDGFDNNCNGATDEGNPGGGATCNTGLLGACSAGTTTCNGGAVVCTQTTPPGPEICDGIDNNCNGQVDEGDPQGGVNCNTGLPGICAPGTKHCQSGALACVQNSQPQQEVCFDNTDNNCDGLVDKNAYAPADGANTCPAAGLVNVATNGQVDIKGIVDPNGDDYYLVTFNGVLGAGTYYHPKIELIDSAGGFYKIFIYDSGCANTTLCSAVNRDVFEMFYPDNPNSCLSYGVCNDQSGKPTSFKVKVTRANGAAPTICATYTVRASNI